MPPPRFLLAAAVLAAGAPVGRAQPTTGDAARAVVRAVTERAKELSQGGNRPKGDALTTEYVRAAARAAADLDKPARAAAFLVGIGVALDDSTILRNNPLTSKVCRATESDAERKERLAVLGEPTVRGRRDLCQHFAVSAALTELLGPDAAEAAGQLKEYADMNRKGGSGFSFVDLAADYAGVEFAKQVRKDPKRLAALADGFAVADYAPAIDGLKEGLTAAKFAADYGSSDDDRFQAAVGEVRKRVAEAPAYRK